MRKGNILLAGLLMVLGGCQPEVTAKSAEKRPVDKPAEWRLADKTGCFMCHKTGKNLLGPSWEAVSERYRNNPNAEAYLMDKITQGGSGAWSNKDMPAYSEDLLSEANLRILVKYILSL